MAPRIKKTYSKKNSWDAIKEKNEGEKENKNLEGKEKNVNEEPIKDNDTKEVFDKLLELPLKEKLNFKPLSFWSKKLKDLESEKSLRKEKKCGLYDFSGTDDSQSPYKKKKKSKRKPAVQKKKRPDYGNFKPLKACKVSDKKIETHTQFKERIMLNKEREKLADRGEKFTFSTGMPSLGVSSTPAVNKDNLVGALSFPFLSPIIKEEDSECGYNGIQCTPLKSNVNKTRKVLNSKHESPKVETKLKTISCKRVLRSGKVINT